MTTYAQWWKTFRKRREVRPVTWVCGSERTLVEDVVKEARKRLIPAPWNYFPVTVGDISEADLWSLIYEDPLGSADTRMILVRGAERLRTPERLMSFVKRADAHPGVFVVLVSGEEKIRRLPPTEEQERKGARGDVVPWLAKLGAKAHVIECSPFTQATAPVAVDWVVSKTGMRNNVAGYLLNRANGDMRLVRDACLKLQSFGHEVTIAAVNDLLSERPRDTFVNALIALDRKTALRALEDMTPETYGKTLALLDSRLDFAGMIHDMQVQHATPYDIARAAGNKNFLVKDLLEVSRHYDAKRRASIRQVLAVADASLRSGARTGLMESVVALW